MDILTFVLVLIVVGVLLWAVNTYIPMDARIKQILNIAVVVAVIIWVLNVFGLFARLGSVRIGG